MRGLNKSKENEVLYQELGNKENKLFSSMKEVYVLAALIGGLVNKREAFNENGGDAIKGELFNRVEKTFFDFIAIDSTKDLNILKLDEENEEEKAKLIEGYSNGGMYILKEYLGEEFLNLDNFINAIENIDKFIDEERAKNSNSLNEILRNINITIK